VFRLAVVGVPLSAAAVAVGINQLVPLLSPLLVALAVGAVVGNTPLNRHRLLTDQAALTKLMLRLGVVLLGLRLPLGDIAALGGRGVLVIVVTAGCTFVATCLIGDRLGVERGLVTLIAAGFSICGAAAIAAVEGGIRRRTEDVALAIAMVTIFGSAMIVTLPLASRLLGLDGRQQGVWAGASIHEVAQVVAAATTAGTSAVAVATTIKLGRVALLAFAYMAARRRGGSSPEPPVRTPAVPWFVVGFLAAAAVRSLGIVPTDALDVANIGTNLLLACAMFGLGLTMQARTLFPVPLGVVGLAASSTIVAASVSLSLILMLF
jgi:uncharacterized integral membrane protein (TIGR00698 family)